MISANNVTLRIGKKALFEDVNIKFTEGNCYGLIGANGAGKSTFLKILSGQLEPTNGDISITAGQRLSFLQQDHFKYDAYTVLDTVIMGNKRLYEIIARVKSRAQASLASAGHSTAVLRGASYASPMAAFQDEMAGIGYYQFIEKLEKDFDSCKDEIVKNLRKVMEEVIRPENFCVSYTGERESLDVVKAQAAGIKKVLFHGQKPESVKQAPCIKKNEAFKTSGQVQYVAQNGNFRKKGLEYTGALEILKVILSYDYLWINLRVKGGAYGCMSGFKRNGESFLVSYRDPHLKRTLEVYQGVPDYIRAFEADEREMTKYIIGTISNKDVPRTPQMQGSISKTAYFSNVTEDMLQKERNQILGAQKEDIQKLAALVEAVLSDDQICVVGSETAIEKAEDVFMEVKPLIG